VHDELRRQLNGGPLPLHFARFVCAAPGARQDGLGARERELLDRLGDEVHPLGAALGRGWSRTRCAVSSIAGSRRSRS
jgi:hypothetical protein